MSLHPDDLMTRLDGYGVLATTADPVAAIRILAALRKRPKLFLFSSLSYEMVTNGDSFVVYTALSFPPSELQPGPKESCEAQYENAKTFVEGLIAAL